MTQARLPTRFPPTCGSPINWPEPPRAVELRSHFSACCWSGHRGRFPISWRSPGFHLCISLLRILPGPARQSFFGSVAVIGVASSLVAQFGRLSTIAIVGGITSSVNASGYVGRLSMHGVHDNHGDRAMVSVFVPVIIPMLRVPTGIMLWLACCLQREVSAKSKHFPVGALSRAQKVWAR